MNKIAEHCNPAQLGGHPVVKTISSTSDLSGIFECMGPKSSPSSNSTSDIKSWILEYFQCQHLAGPEQRQKFHFLKGISFFFFFFETQPYKHDLLAVKKVMYS